MPPRYFATTASPFQNRRSVLSPKADWPAEPPLAPRYSDEQLLALRAWASAHFRQLPAAEQLRVLLHYPGLNARPLYARQARQALATGCAQQQAAALKTLTAETERLRENRRRLRQHVPHLFTAIAA